jgi:hypothetical protein
MNHAMNILHIVLKVLKIPGGSESIASKSWILVLKCAMMFSGSISGPALLLRKGTGRVSASVAADDRARVTWR